MQGSLRVSQDILYCQVVNECWSLMVQKTLTQAVYALLPLHADCLHTLTWLRVTLGRHQTFLTLTIAIPSLTVLTCGCGLMTYPKASHVAVVAMAVSHQRGYSAIHTWIELTRPFLCSMLV